MRDAEVILTGTVESRYAKRRVEDIGESVRGVRHIENRLRVMADGPWPGYSRLATIPEERAGSGQPARD